MSWRASTMPVSAELKGTSVEHQVQEHVGEFRGENHVFRSLDVTHDTLMPLLSRLYVHEFAATSAWDNGGVFPHELHRRLRQGYAEPVAEAERLMQDLELDLSSWRRSPTPRPVGSAPRVGAYLAGDPNSMWGHDTTEDALGPVRVYVGVGSSGGVSQDVWMQRGIACLALAMSLSQLRPTELVICESGSAGINHRDAFVTFNLGLSPLDVSRACAYLCHIGVGRVIAYPLEGHITGHTGVHAHPNAWPRMAEGEMVKLHAARDGVQAVHVPSVFLTETQAIVQNPRAWVEKTLRAAMRGTGAAFTDYAALCGNNP